MKIGIPIQLQYVKGIYRDNNISAIFYANVEGHNLFIEYLQHYMKNESAVSAYIVNNNGIPESMFSYIDLYNISSGRFYSIKLEPTNKTNGYTLLIIYLNTYRNGTNTYRIYGADMLNGNFTKTNIFNLLFTCNYSSCPLNNNQTTFNLVYENDDTKIFKINYS